MGGIGSIFGHPNAARTANGGSALDGQSPITMTQQFGSVAPLTLPKVSRQLSIAAPAGTSVPSAGNVTIMVFAMSVPPGQVLTLTRVGYYSENAQIYWTLYRVGAYTTGWKAANVQGEETPGLTLYDNTAGIADGIATIAVGLTNATGGPLTVILDGIWANLRLE